MLWSPAATAKRTGLSAGIPGTGQGLGASPGSSSASWRSSLQPQPHSSSHPVTSSVCAAPALIWVQHDARTSANVSAPAAVMGAPCGALHAATAVPVQCNPIVVVQIAQKWISLH